MNKENEPKTAAEYLDRGCDKDDQRDRQGALADYNKAIELNPNYAEAYANRGCVKEELGDKQGALDDWKKAADLGDEESAKWIKEAVTDAEKTLKSLDDLLFPDTEDERYWRSGREKEESGDINGAIAD